MYNINFMQVKQMASVIATVGPRILIPGVLIGPQFLHTNDYVKPTRTLAFAFLFSSFAVLIFSKTPLLAFIPGIAALAYWNMMRDEKNIDTYRYADWALTTPLMLFTILSANGASAATVFNTIVFDLLMIGTGYLGAVERDAVKRRALFALGCLAFIPILCVIATMKKTRYAIYLTLVMWILYPLLWYADEEGVLQKSAVTISYSVMDVIAKVGLVSLLQI